MAATQHDYNSKSHLQNNGSTFIAQPLMRDRFADSTLVDNACVLGAPRYFIRARHEHFGRTEAGHVRLLTAATAAYDYSLRFTDRNTGVNVQEQGRVREQKQ